jgi:hypothetical protein
MNILNVPFKLQLNELLFFLNWNYRVERSVGKETFNIKPSVGITSYAQSVGKCYSNGWSVGIRIVRRYNGL